MSTDDQNNVQAGLTDGADVQMGFNAEPPAKPKNTRKAPPALRPTKSKATALKKPSEDKKTTATPKPGKQPSIKTLVDALEELQKFSAKLAAKEKAEATAEDKVNQAQDRLEKAQQGRLAVLKPVLEKCTGIYIGVGPDEKRRAEFVKACTYIDGNGDSVSLEEQARENRSFAALLVLAVHPYLVNEKSASNDVKLNRCANVVKLAAKERPKHFGGWLAGSHERADGSVANGFVAAANRASDEFKPDEDKKAEAKEAEDTFETAIWFMEKKCPGLTMPAVTRDVLEEVALVPVYMNHKTHKLYLAFHQAQHGRKPFLARVKNAANEAAKAAEKAKKAESK